ncbi:MAG: PAS domain-containing protein [Hymenobacter sp.]
MYELVNPSYQQLFPSRRLLGRPSWPASPAWHSLRRVYETGQTHEELEMRVPIARREGGPLEDFYFHYIQQARYDEQGRIDGVVVFALDITDHNADAPGSAALQGRGAGHGASSQAQEREAFYQVFEQTPAAIAFLRGPEHRLVYFNPTYQRLFPDRAAQGRTLAEMQPEAEAQGFVALPDKVYQSGENAGG